MPRVATPESRKRSESAVLDQAIQQLLGATRTEAKKKGQPVDRVQLRKEGCSERFIEKVEKA